MDKCVYSRAICLKNHNCCCQSLRKCIFDLVCKRNSCFYIEFIATSVYRTGPSLLIFSKLVGRKPKPCVMKKSVCMVGGKLIRARTILSLRSASLRREIVFHFIPDCVTQTREQTTRCHWCHPAFERLENKPSRQIGFNMKGSTRRSLPPPRTKLRARKRGAW